MPNHHHEHDPKIPPPKEAMRAWRPYLFSDSESAARPQLPRAAFEDHLETLTSRKEETPFEHFCRRLAEKELCPNLRVQTGLNRPGFVGGSRS
jgi:hypothetical protein